MLFLLLFYSARSLKNIWSQGKSQAELISKCPADFSVVYLFIFGFCF